VKDTCFFVIGHPRSGTTALAELLNASDNIACLFYEGNVLYRLWRTLSRHNVLCEPYEDLVLDFKITAKHNLVDRAQEAGCKKITFSPSEVLSLVEGFREDLESTESPGELYHNTGNRLFRLLGCSAGSEAVGDKVPDYIIIPDILSSALPGCKMLYVERDPRATIHSVSQFTKDSLHLFAVPSAFAMAFSFLLKHKGMLDFMRHLPKHTLLSLTQAELQRDPKAVGIKAGEFLGIPVCAKMASHADRMVRNKHVKNWRSEMAEDDIAAVEAVCVHTGFGLPSESAAALENNHWSEKASRVCPLLDCTDDGISAILDDIRPGFKSKDDRRTLGLTLIQFADYAHARGNFARARLYLEEAVQLIPDHPVLWFKLAELCFDMKLLDQSRKHYHRVETLSPKSTYFSLLRAKTFYQLGRIERLAGSNKRASNFLRHSLSILPGFKLSMAMLRIL
jgi:tetratricopeptide (TPR) repeat protein